MARIHILPDRVANQIAAGEVVERPASVVRELLENALDAGASRVEIEFRHGGKSYLRVEDNGHGMTPDDALLALERHATSKISEAADLNTICTFGFRGEALPAIASVSRFTLATRTPDAPEGTEILIHGGKLVHRRATGCPPGTRIEVAHLFNSVPARRKFLKTDDTESAHITRLARLYAIAHPDVAFSLLEDGRPVFRSPSCRDLRERVAEIWGRRAADELVEFPDATDAAKTLRLHGLLGRPGQGRQTRDGLITLVNRRPVDSRTISYAVLEAYHTYIPKGRYPPAILLLDIDPALVDVNVHPAKREVRFRDEPRVRQFVLQTVLTTLRNLAGDTTLPAPTSTTIPVPAIHPPATSTLNLIRASERARSALTPTSNSSVQSETPGSKLESQNFKPESLSHSQPDSPNAKRETPNPKPETPSPLHPSSFIPHPSPIPHPSTASPFSRLETHNPKLETKPLPVRFPWRLIGRWRGHLYLFESPNGLVLLNARAAHERVWFEELQSRFATSRAISQSLLFPIPLELVPLPASALAEHRAWLNKQGFALEEFGRNFYRLEAVPDWLDPTRAEAFLRDLADLAHDGSHATTLPPDAIARLAATRALRLGDQPTDVEIRSLAARLLATSQPLTSPHGTPTFVEFPATDLARRLGGDPDSLFL